MANKKKAIMGRPTVSDPRKPYPIRLSDAEYTKIKKDADKADLNFSGWVRKKLLED